MEKRNGLLLGHSDEKSVLLNKSIIEKGIELFRDLVIYAIVAQYKELLNLAKIPSLNSLPDKTHLDVDWIDKNMAQLVSFLRNCNIVEQERSTDEKYELITPEKALIPYNDDTEISRKIWVIAKSIYSNQLPRKDSIENWGDILRSWSSYLHVDVKNMHEALTIENFASKISIIGSTKSLNDKMGVDPKPNVFEWLNDFFNLIHENQPEILNSVSLIPNQMDSFKKKSELYRDENIDEGIKQAHHLLGSEIKVTLCDTRVTKTIQNILVAQTQEEALRQSIALLKQKTESQMEFSKDSYRKASVILFYWLADKRRFELLSDNFPVLTSKNDKGGAQNVSRLLQKQQFLKPIILWDEDARLYADLFPDHLILSDKYATDEYVLQNKQSKVWENLVEGKLIFSDFFVTNKEKLDDFMIRKLSAEGNMGEQEDHGSINEVNLTSIVFLENSEDWGILNKCRRSRPKASQLVNFLLGYVASRDSSFLKPITVECTCKEPNVTHQVLPSKWLFALKARQWVPVGRNKEELPTVENIASLFQTEPKLLEYLRETQPSLLLNAIGISTSQILVALQPPSQKPALNKAFAKLLWATNSNVSELEKIAEVYQDLNMRTKLQEAFDTQKRIQRNQKIGKLIEQILRDALERSLPKEQFVVSRITAGADIGIDVDWEFDIVSENNKPVSYEVKILDHSFIIEVKATFLDYVRITVPQAREAVRNPASFALCVVELPPNFDSLGTKEAEEAAKASSKFLLSLGSKLQDRLVEAEEFQGIHQEMRSPSSDEIVIDTSDVQIRFRIKKDLWTKGELPVIDYLSFVDSLVKYSKVGT